MKSNSVQPIPEGYHTVTPWIIVRGAAQLMDFLKAAFEAVELGRVYNADGSIGHAEARIGDSIVMAFDAKAEWPPTPCFLRLYVADGDAVYRQALKAGATSLTEMTELFFGEKVGRVRDPFGNVWWIQERLEALTPEQMQARAGEAESLNAMQYLQSSLDHELSQRQMK
jgi:uncharacterized glyoxalase superfamily protein PhnB